MLKTCYLCLILSFGFISYLSAQVPEKQAHTVYLIGNTATTDISPVVINGFKEELSRQQQPFTIIHLGDIVSNTGLSDTPTDQEKRKLDMLLQLASDYPQAKLYFLPGDKDWDNSGENGHKKALALEKYLQQHSKNKNVFAPSQACPGPAAIDLSPTLRLIAVNTAWWMHPYNKPESPDTDCDVLTRAEFLEELEEEINDADGKNVLIAGHHPVVSNGVYGGRMPLKKHLFPFKDANPHNKLPLPIIGSFYAAYRQNIGSLRDMAYSEYKTYTKKILTMMMQHPGLVYASAHDYSLQLHHIKDNYQIVSGSFAEEDYVGTDRGKDAMFSEALTGFTKLEYIPDGQVMVRFLSFTPNGTREAYATELFRSPCPETGGKAPANTRYNPCQDPEMVAMVADETSAKSYMASPASVTVAAGPHYKANGFKRMFMGTLYRDSWTTPVQVPYLNLDTEHGGLIPVEQGGRMQTKSLRFKAADGHTYVFRSVDKDPVKAVPYRYRNTIITDMLRDVTPASEPFVPMAVASMLDSTEILHVTPKLYIMPDNPKLGPYRKEFANKMGLMEEHPVDAEEKKFSYQQADDVVRTNSLIRKLYRDNDSQVDQEMLAKARAFDMWIGDQGRHEDNWKWAGFKKDKKTTYYPIPRDRDHAFAVYDGFLPYLGDREWAVPSIESFHEDYTDLKSLNWPARHVDRTLLTSLNRQDWQEAAKYIQDRMTDATIDKAMTTLPDEVESLSANEISKKLKNRRQNLAKAVDKYYLMLARQVDVTGSNKHEYFEVQRLENGNVQVKVYKKKKEESGPMDDLVFDRTFVKGETEEIRLYGLDGNDVFQITGETRKSIPIKVIGGEGDDMITDKSNVHGLSKLTNVYDNTTTQTSLSREAKSHLSDDPDVNEFDRKGFAYNSYFPMPLLFYNRDDGFGAGLGLTFIRHGFRKQPFHSVYSGYVRGSQNGNLQLVLSGIHREALGKWDVGGLASVAHYFPFYNFYGLGNDTEKDEELFDNDFYQARYSGGIGKVFMQYVFMKNSTIRLGPSLEHYKLENKPGTLLYNPDPDNMDVPGQGTGLTQSMAGLHADLDIDLRDAIIFPTRGFRFYFDHSSYWQRQGDNTNFGISEGFAQYYGTAKIGIPITLGLRAGGGINYGDNLPFYKYTSLGQRDNLRGYRTNRFTGDKSAYINSELRFHLGMVQNSFLPFYFGLLTFMDQGRVWYKGESEGDWHRGYGGGFYIAPIDKQYTLSLNVGHSEEETALIQFSVGFRIDRDKIMMPSLHFR